MKKIIILSMVALFAMASFGFCGKKEAPQAPVADAGDNLGKTVYDGKGTCATCHGPLGKGDGPAGVAIKARNFTDASGWKNGATKKGIMKTIKEGIPGTAMASFDKALTKPEKKALTKYVLQLAGK